MRRSKRPVGRKGRIGMKNAHSLDMSNGPLLKNILLFALPMVASGVLQIL